MSQQAGDGPAATLSTAGLSAFYEALCHAHGPQRWWPHQDPAHPRFEIFIGAVLTQHTAWTNVERAIATLRDAGPLTAETLRAHADLAALIRQAGPHRVKARRLHALCEWFLAAGGFATLDTWDTETLCRELRAVSGIGPETADVIALYAFDRPRFVADAYAFRIFERYGWWSGRTRRYETLRRRVEAEAPADWSAADYDELHALIVAHAKTFCHKQAPNCRECPVAERCARIGVS